MKKDKIIIIGFILMGLVVSGIIGYTYYKNNNKKTNTSTTSNASVNVDDSDTKVDWDSLENNTIDDSYTISEGGIYTLTGNINGTITIDTKEDVKLMLDNVTIKATNGPAILVENANNVIIYSNKDTVNTLEDSSSYSGLDEDISAVIFSKDDLVLDGEGKIIIKANYQDGIVSKDDLKVINGNYEINSKDDGIRGKDSVYIINGNFNINSQGDGIKSSNDTDVEKGFILIENGNFTINSGSDGMQSITKLIINNGNINITAKEGLESTYIVINNGNIKISASDDGINASDKSTFMTPTIEVNDGNIEVTMGQGDTDGFDANGNIYINGGLVKVTGQSTFDYDGEGKINGGEVYSNGEKVTELPNQFMGGMGGPNGGNPPDMRDDKRRR